jgi:hypothetical protein
MLASQLGIARSQRPECSGCSASLKVNGPAAGVVVARAGGGLWACCDPAGDAVAGTAGATSGGGPAGLISAAPSVAEPLPAANWVAGNTGGAGDGLAAEAPLEWSGRAAGAIPAGVAESCPCSGVVGGMVAINLSGRGGDACPIGHCKAAAGEAASPLATTHYIPIASHP